MVDNETIRINKVVKELNIGIGTLVDFLKKKGIEVDPSPNSKISNAAYLLAQKEFDKEHLLKEQSKKIIFKIVEPETAVPVYVPKPVPVSAPVTVPAPEKVVEKTVAPIIEQEKVVVELVAESQHVENQHVEAPKMAVPEEEGEDKGKGPAIKVVGKIDLTPKQKKKGKGAVEKGTTVGDTVVGDTVAKGTATGGIPEVSPDVETTVEVTAPVVEHIETKFKKLSGPTITGNIDLSQFEKKKPAAEHQPEHSHKGKRERIQKGKREKVDVAKVAAGKSRPTGNAKVSKGKERLKPVRNEVDEDAVQKQIKETYARMIEGKGKTKGSKYRREKRDLVSQRIQEEYERQELQSNILEVTEFVTVNELASMMNISVVKVIEACMNLGLMVSINQRLDAEAMVLVAEEFGFEVKFVSVEIQDAVEQEEDSEEDLIARPPIVTVMGHVDHGKTSLLDYIRKSNVIAGEAGGITQHIGAYNVHLPNDRQITFLDTPGHEAFTAMRARGAKITDLAIIIVAADDAVMPQTVEAINHAVAAGVPMIFAINKVDKAGANSEKIREQLANMNYLVEDWGGKYQCQEISAKQGLNIEKLLEKVLLEADMLELKANPDKHAVGTVIESSLDKGRGYLATILVQSGTLHVGDAMLSGVFSGRVKAMFNERGQKVDKAGPSMPVSILGLNGAPTAGEIFNVVSDEREARDLANKREQLQRIQNIRTQKHITLEEIGRRIAIGNFQQLNVIVKGDVDGSVEALSDSLIKLSTEEVQVEVIHKAVGGISESDVLLAAASNAIIIGFQVRPSAAARKLAEKEEIEIRLYSVIYDAINEVKSGIEGMLAPEEKEEVTSTVEVREVFKISKVGSVAGCMVKEGKIGRHAKIRIIRNGIVVHTGTLGSLKRFKDDVKEVAAGYDCGLNIDGYNDIKIGDIIEAYTIVEIKRKL
ncbi:MAG: translation initiation factor IF-2 [Bacteroidales bacterium]|nr:translation initiation factor IF-2 [Bacteroidales bacterium]